MKNTISIFLLLVITALNCKQQSGEEIELSIKTKVGDEQLIVFTTETVGNSAMSMKNEYELKFSVADINENIYTYNLDVIGMKSNSNIGGEVEEFNSYKDVNTMTRDESEMYYELKTVLDSTFKISIDNKGNITKPFHYQSGKPFGDVIVEMAQIQIKLPESKVQIGDEWKNERVNELTSSTIKTTFKLTEVSDDKITISSSSLIDGILGKNNSKGEYVLDRNTCQLIQGKVEMDMSFGGKVVVSTFSK